MPGSHCLIATPYLCGVAINSKYQVVIGLEVHAQLLTKSKLFCGDSIAFGAEPNTQVSEISLAHPGTLPVTNEEVINLATRLGLALHCSITRHTFFARKNYFYPDLPKGYQTSQDTTPICKGGYLEITSGKERTRVLLNRIHMEEDAGKSIHDLMPGASCIDLNRAGTPLLEIVTEPCIHSANEAFQFLTELRKILRWLDVCDGNMEEGSMRCDANISVRKIADSKLGTRVEVKNLNSIRNVKRAIEAEAERLVELVENGEPILQQTRSFNADNGTTFALRSKEEADDYRYFPEPDLPAFFISEEKLDEVRSSMPLLPRQLQEKFQQDFALSEYDAGQLCYDKETASFFETLSTGNKNYKSIANWINGPLRAWCNETGRQFGDLPMHPDQLAGLIRLTDDGKVSFNIASTKLFAAMLQSPMDAEALAIRLNLQQENDDDALQAWVKEALAQMPDKVKEYRSGKKSLLGLFAGQVKKLSKGKADMQAVNKILTEELNQTT